MKWVNGCSLPNGRALRCTTAPGATAQWVRTTHTGASVGAGVGLGMSVAVGSATVAVDVATVAVSVAVAVMG